MSGNSKKVIVFKSIKDTKSKPSDAGQKGQIKQQPTDTTVDKKDKNITADSANEIDDLFSTLKSKKSQKLRDLEAEKEEAERKRIRKELKKQRIAEAESQTYGIIQSSYNTVITNPEAPLERIDKESGLPVYKAHLLKVGEGGGTELCPFDCNCCF